MTTDVPLERIVVDPHLLVGKPVVRGTRISVALVIDLLARGFSKQHVLDLHERVYPPSP